MINPSHHEEADTRVILHVVHCLTHGYQKAMIRTVDTDVVVLAIYACSQLENLQELYVAYGSGKDFKYIPAHDIAENLGRCKCEALPFFHALTGCDTTSSFCSKGKKSAWEAWQACPNVTATFQNLSDKPDSINEENFSEVERFIVVLYQKTSEQSSCNEARRELFTSG